jgi:polysaccharide biosynthesis protein PslG
MRTRLALLAAACVTLWVGASAPSAPAVPHDFYGVSPAVPIGDDEFGMMEAGGVGTLRLPLFWQLLEPEDDRFEWAAYDRVVALAAEAEVRILPVLFGTPPWLTDDFNVAPVRSSRERAEWREMLVRVARRYGRGGSIWERGPIPLPLGGAIPYRPIHDWEIWNEQNSPTFWLPRPSPRGYARLLQISHDALAGVDPQANLLVGGMFATPSRAGAIWSNRFLRRVYEVDHVKRWFDGVALHPYAGDLRGVKLQIQIIRRVMRRYGDDETGTWITEIGWSTRGPRDHPLVKTKRGQARMLRRSFELLLDKRNQWEIKQIDWYTWRNHMQECLWCHGAGLFSRRLNPKPSWRAYKSFAQD